ncbi:MAG: DUF5131 family protein [Alphaproteobacteria bacterium]|nr:DUF5131 family protein [Alphaproteobacteria bacterium]
MADNTKIEWADATWNPLRAVTADGKKGWHCEHVSEGCRNCYAETFNERRLGTGLPYKPGHRGDVQHILDEKLLLAPLRRRKPTRYFLSSMTDVFGGWVSQHHLDRIFAVMALAPQHTFMVLTKRPERMRDYFRDIGGTTRADWIFSAMGRQLNVSRFKYPVWPLPNVWLGTSVEDQHAADERIPHLLATSAAIRFLSCEPLLSAVDLEQAWNGENSLDSECWGDCAWCDNGHPPLHNCSKRRQSENELIKGRSGIDWVIAGGESGPGARPMHPDWARSLRDQCATAGVAFHFKQHGEWVPLGMNEPLTGGDWPTAAGGSIRLNPDGTRGSDGWPMQRVGKSRAGRLLDGRTHDDFPGGQANG